MNSKKSVVIEEFEVHNKVTFYTLRYTADKESEADKFFSLEYEYKKFIEDISIIGKMIDKIGENGAFDRNFRREGKFKDNVGALPEHLYSSKLRLYVIHVSENIVILGNGGKKTTKTYNVDVHLNNCVELLQTIDGLFKSRVKKGTIIIYGQKLMGDLTFNI